MKKRVWVALVLATLILMVAVPSLSEAWGGGGFHQWGGRGFHHGGHGRVFIVGPTFWWGAPYPYYYPYPYPVYAPAPAPVIVEQEPAYAAQQPVTPQSYWYYCQSAKGYYPNVQSCPEAWVKVVPRAE